MKKISISLLFVGALLASTLNGSAQLPKGVKKPKVTVPTSKNKSTKSTTTKSTTSAVTKKVEECLEIFDKLSERENRIYKYLDEGKPSLCSSQISQYKRYLEEYKDEMCPNVKQFEDKLPELQAAVAQGKIDKKCKEAKAEMDKYEASAEAYLAAQNFTYMSTPVGFYKRYYNEYKGYGCQEDYSDCDAKIAKWETALKNAAIAQDPLSHFRKAFYDNNKAGMEDAIANGLDIKNSSQPLEIAVRSGDIAKVDYVLSLGANINLKDEDGIVPLDYKINSYPEQADIDMKKHLISKGADLKLANGKWVASDAVEAGDFAFYKKVEAINSFTTNDDLHFYWKAHGYPEMDKYFAEKIKNGNVGKSWSDVPAGLNNSSLQSEMLSIAKQFIIDEELDIKVTKVKIVSKDWGIYRHPISGIITHKGISAVAYGTDKNGVCFYKELGYRKYYDGSRYGKTLLSFWHTGINIVDCD